MIGTVWWTVISAVEGAGLNWKSKVYVNLEDMKMSGFQVRLIYCSVRS